MGNTTSNSLLETENNKLKQNLNYTHQRFIEERERADQLIRDARFVATSTATFLLLGGAVTFFLATKRFKTLETASKSLQRRLELTEREHASHIERMTTTFERNRKAAKESGAADVAKSILGVSDDLGRILRMLETTEGEAFDVKHIDALRNGLKMTRTNLDKAFRSKDIIELNPKGDTFDPNLYEAVTVVQDETFKNKEIVSVSQTGFVMGDRILRPAKVVVNKK